MMEFKELLDIIIVKDKDNIGEELWLVERQKLFTEYVSIDGKSYLAKMEYAKTTKKMPNPELIFEGKSPYVWRPLKTTYIGHIQGMDKNDKAFFFKGENNKTYFYSSLLADSSWKANSQLNTLQLQGELLPLTSLFKERKDAVKESKARNEKDKEYFKTIKEALLCMLQKIEDLA